MIKNVQDIKIGDFVQYEDIANQNGPVGQVCDMHEIMSEIYHGNGSRSFKGSGRYNFEVVYPDGTFKTTTFAQYGWNIVEFRDGFWQ